LGAGGKASTNDDAVLAVKHQGMARSTSSATASVHFWNGLAELRPNRFYEGSHTFRHFPSADASWSNRFVSDLALLSRTADPDRPGAGRITDVRGLADRLQ
jgi:hypothetical protein